MTIGSVLYAACAAASAAFPTREKGDVCERRESCQTFTKFFANRGCVVGTKLLLFLPLCNG